MHISVGIGLSLNGLVSGSIEDDQIDLRALKILGAMDHIDRHTLCDMYISFARIAAEGRTDELPQVIEDIRRAARNQEDFIRDAHQLIDDVRQNLEEQLQEKYSEVLGIATSASPTEIKGAYHRLVRLWHPDRLDGMTPELQAVATEKLRDINEAYSALSGEAAD